MRESRGHVLPQVAMTGFPEEWRQLEPAIRGAIQETIASGWFILGQRVQQFEERFAAYLSGPEAARVHAVGCASGTEAITLALLGLDIGRSSTVVTVPNTCAPTAAGIRMTGAGIRFVDVDPVHLLMSPERLDECLRAGPADAVVVVHLYGNAAPMDAIAEVCSRHGVILVEDCAQAHGASWKERRAGTIGRAAAFSFYPTKNLGAYGDGGAVVVGDPARAERIAGLRNYGYPRTRRNWAVEEGLNSRLDELQAAILLAKLPHLEAWNERRREIAARYDRGLGDRGGITLVPPPGDSVSARHLYVIRCAHRDALARHLAAAGVQTQIHYPVPVHLQPAYASERWPLGSLPVAEKASGEVLSLPIHPFMSDNDVERVIAAIHAFASPST